jgi:hypothetical protein
MEPAAGECLLSCGRILQVSAHDRIAAHEDLARTATADE